MRVLDWGKKRRAFNSVAFDPTGRWLAASGDYQPTVVWDALTGAERCRLDVTPQAHEARFHPRTGKLVLATPVGLRVGDPDTGALTEPDDSVRALDFAPDGSGAVFCRRRGGHMWGLSAALQFATPDQVPLWDASIGDADDESGYAFTVACLPGDRFVSAERVDAPEASRTRFRLAVRSRTDGRLISASPNHAVSYDDRTFAAPANESVVVQDGTQLRIYQSDDLAAPPRVLKSENRKHFTGVAFHPAGRYLAVTSNDKTVKLYDLDTWDVVKAFSWKVGKMRSVCFSPDGALAAAGSDQGTVVVWDLDL